MRKKFYKILATTLIVSLWLMSVPGLWFPAPACALNEKITTAIVGIDCPDELDLPVRIYEALSAAMVKSHRFEVTDHNQIASTLTDMGYEDKALNMTEALEVGKALGVDTITMAQGYGIESDNEKCYITIASQVIDVESGIIIQSAFAVGEGYKGEKFELTDEAINNAVQAVVNQMNDNLSKVGLIAIIKDGEIRINIGGDMGLKDNSEFAVYRDDNVIGKLKTEKLDSYDTLVEKVIVLPGYTLQEGDIVVATSNQGVEIDKVGSPETVSSTGTKVGLILLAILVGVAIALIATNEGDQVSKQPASGSAGYTVVGYEQIDPSRAGRWVVTIKVFTREGKPAPDGTIYRPVTVDNAAFSNYYADDYQLQYTSRNGEIKFILEGGEGENVYSKYQLQDSNGSLSEELISPMYTYTTS